MRTMRLLTAAGLVLALAAAAQALAPGDCLNKLQFQSATMAADMKLTYSGGAKPAKITAKAKKGSGASVSGTVPLSFKPSGKSCAVDASLSDVSMLGSLELGATGNSAYTVNVGTISGSAGKKDTTIAYEIKGLVLELTAPGSIGLKKANGASRFDPSLKVAAGTLTLTPNGGAPVTIDLKSEVSPTKVGKCALQASSKTGNFEMECKNFAVDFSSVTKGPMQVALKLRSSGFKATGAVSATAAVETPAVPPSPGVSPGVSPAVSPSPGVSPSPLLKPTAADDVAAFIPEVLDPRTQLPVEPAYCKASVLKNDTVPDWPNTQVFVGCDDAWFEVNSVYLNAQNKQGVPGCDVKGAAAKDKGASIGFETKFEGNEDPFFVPDLFQAWSYMTYYPPNNYNASYIATFKYKLVRAGTPEAIGTVTCTVGTPSVVARRR